MSLSSDGWAPHTPTAEPPPPSSSSSSHSGGSYGAPPPRQHAPQPAAAAAAGSTGCHTVLMSVRVSVCHSGIRPLCLPGAAAAAGDDESLLRLQLSMDPGKSGEFRLSLRDASQSARSVSISEFDLRAIRYEVKSPSCHELSLAAPPHNRISFNFRCEREAQEWATVVMSSLREAHRVADMVSAEDSGCQPLCDNVVSQSSTDLPRTEEMCSELTRAIEAGDMQAASVIASSLARQHTALKIQPAVRNYEDTEINLAVVIEDSSSSCCVTVKVFPNTTTAALKQQVFLQYGFHPWVQRWVIGQCLCADQRSLASYGVRRDGDTAFLYLLSARHARLTHQLFQQDQESALMVNAPAPSVPAPAPTPAALQPSPYSNGPSSQDRRPYSTLPPRLGAGSNSGPGASSGSDRGNIGDIRDLINLEMLQLNEALGPGRTPAAQGAPQGWSCPSCTYINKPTRPGCEICSTDRPQSYAVPGGYRPDPMELKRIQQEKEAVRQYQLEKGRREELRSAGAQNNSLLYNLDQDY